MFRFLYSHAYKSEVNNVKIYACGTATNNSSKSINNTNTIDTGAILLI